MKAAWLAVKLISYIYLSFYSLVHAVEAIKTPLLILWIAAFAVFMDLFCKNVDLMGSKR